MRLDKFLKVSRIIKRRTVAKQLATEDRVLINDRIAKPATEVFVGDTIEINFEHKQILCEITGMDRNLHNKDGTMYTVLNQE